MSACNPHMRNPARDDHSKRMYSDAGGHRAATAIQILKG